MHRPDILPGCAQPRDRRTEGVEFAVRERCVAESTVKMCINSANMKSIAREQRQDRLRLVREEAIAPHARVDLEMHARRMTARPRGRLCGVCGGRTADRQKHTVLEQRAQLVRIDRFAQHQNFARCARKRRELCRVGRLGHAEARDPLGQ